MRLIKAIIATLTVAIAFTLAAAASADTVASGTCGDAVNWVLDSEGTLTVSGEGAMWDYTSNGLSPWEEYIDRIENVIIEQGITRIGAFSFCNSLVKGVEIPNTVTDIGKMAFAYSALTEVTIPESVKGIEIYAFDCCHDLETVTLSEGLLSIGSSFNCCCSLTEINIPASVVNIASYAFSGCNALERFTVNGKNTVFAELVFGESTEYFPIENLTIYGYTVSTAATYAAANSHDFVALDADLSIASGTCGDAVNWMLDSEGTLTVYGTGDMYQYNSDANPLPWQDYYDRVKHLVVEDGVTSVGYGAFSSAPALESVYLGADVAYVTAQGFTWALALNSFEVSEANTSFCSDEYGVLYTKDMKTLVAYPIGNARTEYSIPEGVEAIALNAFYNCYAIEKIDFPSTLTTIGKSAFVKCTALSEIILPDSLTYLGDSAFYNCSSAEKIVIGSGLSEILGWTFYNCASVTELTLGSALTGIGSYAFESCDMLEEVIIPENVATLGSYCFKECLNLRKAIIYNRKLQTVNLWPFLSSPTVIYGYEGSTAQTLAGQYGHTFVALEEPVTVIASGTCGDAVTWTLDDAGTLTISGEGAMTEFASIGGIEWYRHRMSIKKAVIESGVTRIGTITFFHCENMTEVEIADSVTEIGDRAFAYCISLKKLDIPESVTKVGSGFIDSVPIETFSIHKNLTDIDKIAFNGANFLKEITVDPENTVCVLDEFGVLYDAEKTRILCYTPANELSEYTLPATIKNYSSSWFMNSSLEAIYVEEGNRLFISVDGVLYNAAMETLLYYPCKKQGSEFTVPDGITMLFGSAFYNCEQIECINLPDSLVNINGQAFYGCKALTSISIPSSVTTLDLSAFACCDSLTEIVIPDSVTKIGQQLFMYCSALKDVKLPYGMTSITRSMFRGCTSLKTVKIPGTVTSLADWAFDGCTELVELDLPAEVESISRVAFNNCPSLEKVIIRSESATIPAKTFDKTAHPSLTLYGYSGSTTEAYAAANGIPFELLTAEVIAGDANGDGKSNAIDLAHFQRYLAGWTGYDDTTVNVSAFDLNGDGKANAIDAAVLARHIAGWIGYETIPLKP